MKNPVIKTIKNSKKTKIKETIPRQNLEIKSLFTVFRENQKGFEFFMKSKSCEEIIQIIEIKPALIIFFNNYFGDSKLRIKQIKCPNGLLKDFQLHFEKVLKSSRVFNAEKDFALFVISYLNPQKVSKKKADESLNKIKEHKGGRPIDPEMETILALKNHNPSLTSKKLAIEIVNEEKKNWIKQKVEKGMIESEAITAANLKFNKDYVEEKKIRIGKSLQYHKAKKTKQKSSEKYFQDTENYLLVFRTGNIYFIVNSDGDKTAESLKMR